MLKWKQNFGYSRNERTNNENSRNGYYPEGTVSTEMGDIPVKVPRDRNGEIDSDLVPKYSITVNGFDEKVIAMYALGLSDKDIQEQINEIFGCSLSPDMISDITNKIIPEIQEWQKRKLESVYPIIFIDATHFNVRDNGQIVKKAAYVVLGIDKDGMKKVLTITIGENESAKYWMTVLNELKNRGVQNILVLCADGLTGLKDAIGAIFPKTEYQRCIVHQIRNSLKYVPYTDKKELASDLKTVYKASTEEIAYTNLLELEEKWKNRYPGAIQSWIDNWDVLSIFFKFSAEIRKIMYTTNAIESLNSTTYKRINRNRNVFPKTQSQRCVVHLVRNIYALCPRKEAKQIISDYKRIYAATSLEEATIELEAFEIKYAKYPKIVKKVQDFMQYLEPLFELTQEIRKCIYTTNTIESINSTFKKMTRGKGAFPSEVAVYKVLYLRIKELSDKWIKPIQNWKVIQQQLIELFGDRYSKHLKL